MFLLLTPEANVFVYFSCRNLERLGDKVGQDKCKYDELKVQAEAQALMEKGALSKASTLEVQLRLTCDNSLVRIDMITKLESEILKIKAKVVDARAEAVMSRAKAEKKVVVYLKDTTDAQAGLRRTLDHEGRSKEYIQCKSLRETLEEIYARDFNLSEEMKRAKADEYGAKSLLSNAEDSEDEANGP